MSANILFQTPGNREGDWLLPLISLIIYWISLIVSALVHLYYAFMCIAGLFVGRMDAPVFMARMLAILIALPISYLISVLLIRLSYEGSILLFKMFLAQREIADQLASIQETVECLSQTHLQSSQYVCDRLAEIVDHKSI